jgi:SAM-dependent methyltransferase
MKNPKEFLSQRQTASGFNLRLENFVKEYKNYANKYPQGITILDVGCGHNCELFSHKRSQDHYSGCDFFEKVSAPLDNYCTVNFNEQKLTDIYRDKKFDVIFCGEVIEHLFSPDEILDEIKKLMKKDSIFILSTPNLGYYLNRIMLLFGISPFFLENSSEIKLGRFFSFLGQGNVTEGHIRLFTYRALMDLLKRKNFKVIKVQPVPVWNNITDRIVCLFSKSLSANNVFVLQIQDDSE